MAHSRCRRARPHRLADLAAGSIVSQVYTVSDPRLPAAFDGLRIAHLSDLHGKEFGRDNTRLLAEVAALQPDLIALTGDFIDQSEQIEILPSLLDGLTAIAPTYFVTGNHDWAAADSMRSFKALLEVERKAVEVI